MTCTPADVLIVGAGPVGTALAIDLTRRGVAVRTIDKAQHGFGGSRAKGVQPRTLEVLEDLGALGDVIADGATYPLMGVHLGPITVPWRMLRSPHAGDPGVPYPHTWLVSQERTDRALRARLTALRGSISYRHEVVELTQSPDIVTATVATPEGHETLTARYAVGADGGASTVRQQLGIGFLGSTNEADRMLIVDATVDGALSRRRWHVWPQLRGGFIGACPLPHSNQFQWMIKLNPGETPPVDEQQITAVIRARIGDKRLSIRDITWKSLYRTNIRLAEHYRIGRIFLAGDAAHTHPPAGAQGLNTGIQDSYNLGWKIAQALAGAPPQLLDSYESERRPIATAVLDLSTKKFVKMANLNPSRIRRGKDEQQLTIGYRGGPLAPTNTQHTATLTAGDRAPDAYLDDHGTVVRLFDIYRGAHFTALAYGARAAVTLASLPWPTYGAALTRVVVNAGSEPEHADYRLQDSTGDFAKSYGISSAALILVRPDGYLASVAIRDLLATTEAAIRPFIAASSNGAMEEPPS